MPMTISQKGKHRTRPSSAIDLSSEQQVETVLDGAGIFYNKTETWIDSEKLYEVLYSFDMEGL